jgi:hypothetical protein
VLSMAGSIQRSHEKAPRIPLAGVNGWASLRERGRLRVKKLFPGAVKSFDTFCYHPISSNL